MTTKELMAIINTRLACEAGNPTSRSFLLYVSEAMKRLKAYEDADPAIQAKQVAEALDELDMEDL
jgi:hypothetical protein